MTYPVKKVIEVNQTFFPIRQTDY